MRARRTSLAVFACAALGVCLPGPAAGEIFPAVCSGTTGNVASLRSAIDAANTNTDPDVVTLGPNCVYTLSAPPAETRFHWFGPSGLPAIASPVTIEGNGATIERPAGEPKFRLFFIGADKAHPDTLDYTTPGPGVLTLRDVVLRGGLAAGGSSRRGGGGAGLGGAIFNQGTLTIERSTLTQNTARGGSSGVGSYDSGGGIGTDAGEAGGGGFGPGDFGGQAGGTGDSTRSAPLPGCDFLPGGCLSEHLRLDRRRGRGLPFAGRSRRERLRGQPGRRRRCSHRDGRKRRPRGRGRVFGSFPGAGWQRQRRRGLSRGRLPRVQRQGGGRFRLRRGIRILGDSAGRRRRRRRRRRGARPRRRRRGRLRRRRWGRRRRRRLRRVGGLRRRRRARATRSAASPASEAAWPATNGGGGAGMGGALFNMQGEIAIRNSTLAANSAVGGGPEGASAGWGIGGALTNLSGARGDRRVDAVLELRDLRRLLALQHRLRQVATSAQRTSY